MRIAPSLVLWCLAACAPYRPPPQPPRLVVARAPVRVFAEAAAPSLLTVLARAGSAYDPPGREGTAFVYAHGVASVAGAAVEVGPELVAFAVGAGGEAALAAALGAPVSAAALDTGRAAAARAAAGTCTQLAARLASAWALAGTPYGHPATGRASVLSTLSLGEMEAFRRLRYVRDAVVVVSDGQVDAAGFVSLFPPVMSPRVTPAVRPRESRPDIVVSAPVDEACTAFSPQRLSTWTADDQAAYLVALELAGLEPPPAHVDPAATLRLPGLFTAFPGVPGDLAAARSVVLARLARPTARWAGEWALLGDVRGSLFSPIDEVKQAVLGLNEPALSGWLASRFGAGAIVLQVRPTATVESPTPGNVISSEDLLR